MDNIDEKLHKLSLRDNLYKTQKIEFLELLKKVFDIYVKYGARSSKKVIILHEYIRSKIQKCLSSSYSVKIEKDVPSCNSTGKKRCDIVLYKDNIIIAVFPVKFIMSNYKQNKNNFWETMTGEIMHLIWKNHDICIIPINIIFNQVPYLKSSKVIKKFENINLQNSFKIMDILNEKKITSDIVNYIIDVKHQCSVGEIYDRCPIILDFNKETPFRCFSDIVCKIIR